VSIQVPVAGYVVDRPDEPQRTKEHKTGWTEAQWEAVHVY